MNKCHAVIFVLGLAACSHAPGDTRGPQDEFDGGAHSSRDGGGAEGDPGTFGDTPLAGDGGPTAGDTAAMPPHGGGPALTQDGITFFDGYWSVYESTATMYGKTYTCVSGASTGRIHIALTDTNFDSIWIYRYRCQEDGVGNQESVTMAPRFTSLVNGRLYDGEDDVGFVSNEMISYRRCDPTWPTCMKFEVARLANGELAVIDETPFNDLVNSFALQGLARKE